MATGSRGKRDLSPNHCEIPGCRGVPGYPGLIQRHRIIPGREKGKYKRGNVISLCPNHHALADRDLISSRELLQIVDKRIREEKLEQKKIDSESTVRSRSPEESRSNITEESVQGDGSSSTNGPNGLRARLINWGRIRR